MSEAVRVADNNPRASRYIRAAERLGSRHDDVGCCWAIYWNSGSCHRDVWDFEALFKPIIDNGDSWWGNRWSRNKAERHQCRVLALCFMAAIAEDEHAQA